MRHISSVVRRASVVCLSLFALVLAGCGGPSPESVVEKFFKAVADNRAEEAISYCAIQDVKENDLTAAKGKLTMVVGAQYAEIQGNGGLESIKTGPVEQEGDKARVKVELKFKNGKTEKEDISLVNEKGWKIILR